MADVQGRVTISTAQAIAAIEELKSALEELVGQTYSITVTSDTADANEQLEDARAQAEELDATDPTITVSADTAESDAKLAEVKGEADSLDAEDVNIKVTADTSEADAKLAGTKVAAETAGGGGAGGGGGGEAEEATESAGEDTSAGTGGLNAKFAKLAVSGPMAATAIAGAFTALPGILAGVSGAVGSLIAGFMGIGQAISAYIAVENSASQITLQLQSIQINQAQSMANASAQITQATMQVAQAQVQAYDTVYQAQIQLTMSEQELESAQYGQRQSQLSLTEATMQAKFQLENYKQQMSDMVIQVQQAQIGVTSARLRLAETMGDPAAITLQRQQAQVAYAQAKQQLSDLLLQQKQLGQQAAFASKLGVQGSINVRAATQNVTASNYQLANAHKGVQTAQMYLQQSYVEGARNMRMATLDQTMAVKNLGWTMQQFAIQLKEPIGAYAQLQVAMNALGPAGQQFVQWFMTSMYPVLKQLEYSAEGALLPGIQKALSAMGPYLKEWGGTFTIFAEGFVAFLGQFTKFVNSPVGKAEFTAAMKEGLVFMQDLGTAIVNVMKIFGGFALHGKSAVSAIGGALVDVTKVLAQMASSGAVTEIANGFAMLMKVFTDVGKSLGGGGLIGLITMLVTKFSPFGMVLGTIIMFLPQLMPLLQAAARIFGVLMIAIKPIVNVIKELVLMIAQQLATELTMLTPVLMEAGKVIGALLQALMPLIPIILQLSMVALKPLISILMAVLPAIQLLAKPISQIATLIGAVLQPVIGVITDELQFFAKIITAVLKIAIDIIIYALSGWIKGLELVLRYIDPLIQRGVKPLHAFLNDLWKIIVQVARSLEHDFVRVLHMVGDALRPIAHMVGMVTHGISSLGKGIGGAIGGIGHFLGLAEGGYISQPTMAVVGESGPEVVLPLNNPQRMLEILRPLLTSGHLPVPPGSTGGATMGGGQNTTINLQAISNADPQMIAHEVAWAMRTQSTPR